MALEESLWSLIRMHEEHRPLLRAVDVYKLLYQGIFGVGHILGEGAFERLEAEARGLKMDEHPEEPLVEPVSVDGSMVRVNLRPYIRLGLPLDELFSAMKETEPVNDAGEFIRTWNIFKELVREGRLRFDLDEINELNRGLDREHIPPRHHSQAYRDAYTPSYRVVGRRLLKKVLGEHGKII